eukprot:UN25065
MLTPARKKMNVHEVGSDEVIGDFHFNEFFNNTWGGWVSRLKDRFERFCQGRVFEAKEKLGFHDLSAQLVKPEISKQKSNPVKIKTFSPLVTDMREIIRNDDKDDVKKVMLEKCIKDQHMSDDLHIILARHGYNATTGKFEQPIFFETLEEELVDEKRVNL